MLFFRNSQLKHIAKIKAILVFSVLILGCMFFTNCNDDKKSDQNPGNQSTIADYSVAKELVLRSIPKEYIDRTRTTLHIAYQHTSHGTHVSRGLFGLPDFKNGDYELFGITNNAPQAGKLDFHDYAIGSYAAPGESASDLSSNETGFIQATRNFLDDEANDDINVIMWSWCNIAGHDVATNYLPGMDALISEYGEGVCAEDRPVSLGDLRFELARSPPGVSGVSTDRLAFLLPADDVGECLGAPGEVDVAEHPLGMLQRHLFRTLQQHHD